MIHDAQGRPLRRAIGFLRVLVSYRDELPDITGETFGYKTVDVEPADDGLECREDTPPRKRLTRP